MDLRSLIDWLTVQQYFADGGDLSALAVIWGLKIVLGGIIGFTVVTIIMWFFLPWSIYSMNKKLRKMLTYLELSTLYLGNTDKGGEYHEIEDVTDRLVNCDDAHVDPKHGECGLFESDR